MSLSTSAGGSGSVTLVQNNGLFSDTFSSQGLRSTEPAPAPAIDKWAPKTNKLENNANSLPIWPAKNNNFVSPSDQFTPINTFRFPNRRIDDYDIGNGGSGGVGEVSLVNDRASGLSEKSSQSYKISDRLDFTSDNEFVVSTSMSMNQAGPSSPKYNINNQLQSSNRDTGYGFVTPVPSSSIGIGGFSGGSGTAASSGTISPRRGSDVFHLGSGVQIQQPNNPHSPVSGVHGVKSNENYILPTYTRSGSARLASRGAKLTA